MLLHPSLRTLLVENGRNNVLIGLPDLAKEIIENRDKLNITKHLIFLFVFLKGDHFNFFTNSKLVSELVSSDKLVFLCIYATQL